MNGLHANRLGDLHVQFGVVKKQGFRRVQLSGFQYPLVNPLIGLPVAQNMGIPSLIEQMVKGFDTKMLVQFRVKMPRVNRICIT